MQSAYFGYTVKVILEDPSPGLLKVAAKWVGADNVLPLPSDLVAQKVLDISVPKKGSDGGSGERGSEGGEGGIGMGGLDRVTGSLAQPFGLGGGGGGHTSEDLEK